MSAAALAFDDKQLATQNLGLLRLRPNVRADKATLFAVEGGVAKSEVFKVFGEAGGSLFVEPKLKAGTPVVVEGRALLDDGDKVEAKESAL
jgi:hypothetical protein